MKTRQARYQQGSIRKVKRTTGYAWKVRFSQKKDNKRNWRTPIYNGAEYQSEKQARMDIELAVSQINSGTAAVFYYCSVYT